MAPVDTHYGEYGNWNAPAANAKAVAPNDGADFEVVARALYIGGAGDVKLVTVGGDTVTFASVPAGSILPVAVGKVFATGTTATGIIALR